MTVAWAVVLAEVVKKNGWVWKYFEGFADVLGIK